VAHSGSVRIEAADQVGRYTIHQRLPGGELVDRTFYVDLFGETEADIVPRDRANTPARASPPEAVAQTGPVVWLPFVALALGVLSVEWLHFVRRG
jgi:hypothetical protein